MQTTIEGTVVVAGGTGNVGSHVVNALLEHGATVAVPSRSENNLAGLRDFLRGRLDDALLARLITIEADISDAADAQRVVDAVVSQTGGISAAVAALGRFTATPTLLRANPDVLRQVMDDYTMAHFTAARSLLPALLANGGKYVFVNGPLAFAPWPNSGGGLVSIATAAQHMLFLALAQELDDTAVEVNELVTYAFVRERETQPGSAVRAESVGEYVAFLLSSAAPRQHGQTIHLRSENALAAAGIGVRAAHDETSGGAQ